MCEKNFYLFKEIQKQLNNIEKIVKEDNKILNPMLVDSIIEILINENNSKKSKK